MNTAHNSIVYRKQPVRPMTWLAVGSALVLSSVLPALLDTSGRFYPDFIFYGLTWGLVFIIWLITLWSINRYGTVTITDTEFRVGRHKVNKADIDTVALMEVSQDDESFVSNLTTSAGNIDLPVLLTAENLGNPSVFGGSYGVPLGTNSFIMSMKDGRTFTVPLPRGSRKEVITHLLKKKQELA